MNHLLSHFIERLIVKYNLDMTLAPFLEDRHQGLKAEIQQSHPFYKVFSQHQPKHEIAHRSFSLSDWHLLQPGFCEYIGLPVFESKGVKSTNEDRRFEHGEPPTQSLLNLHFWLKAKLHVYGPLPLASPSCEHCRRQIRQKQTFHKKD